MLKILKRAGIIIPIIITGTYIAVELKESKKFTDTYFTIKTKMKMPRSQLEKFQYLAQLFTNVAW